MDKNQFIRIQRDHCFAQSPVDDDGRLTMYALGGFVPDGGDAESDAEVLEYFKKFPPLKSSFACPGTVVRPHVMARMENEFRLSLVSKIADFLEVLEMTGCSVRQACKKSGINRQLSDALRVRVPAFKAAWDDIFEAVTDSLEEAGLKRAVDGVEEDVYFHGMKVGKKRVYSDSLLSMMLQGRRSSVYKQRTAAELTGKDGAPITTFTANVSQDGFRAIARQIADDV